MSLDMYAEEILELYKNPNNKGKLDNHTNEFFLENTLCGDEIRIKLIVENNKIKDVKFQGEGCAISTASASMVTDKIKGMNIEQIKKLNKEDVFKLLKIPISPSRIRCALLCLDCVKEALKDA